MKTKKFLWCIVLYLFVNMCTNTLTWGTETGFPENDQKILNNRPADIRYPIKNTEWPNCLFGIVKTNSASGSGTLIRPNVVLTAAHVIYDRDARRERESIFFCPCQNGGIAPYGRIGVTSIYCPEAYKVSISSGHPCIHDWALLQLGEAVGYKIEKEVQERGWFDLKVCSDIELNQRPIHIYGYPGEKDNELFGGTGTAKSITDGIITYYLDTTPGQSGGGVWVEFNGKKYIVGCHQGGESRSFNYATRWTQDKHDYTREFCKRAVAASTRDGFDRLYLIYKPNIDNDIGIQTFQLDSFERTFDLSECGSANQYLSISTGYRKIINSANSDKLEIWIAPRFLIERELNTTAKHFQPIFTEDEWPSENEICIFLNFGDWSSLECYDYFSAPYPTPDLSLKFDDVSKPEKRKEVRTGPYYLGNLLSGIWRGLSFPFRSDDSHKIFLPFRNALNYSKNFYISPIKPNIPS